MPEGHHRSTILAHRWGRLSPCAKDRKDFWDSVSHCGTLPWAWFSVSESGALLPALVKTLGTRIKQGECCLLVGCCCKNPRFARSKGEKAASFRKYTRLYDGRKQKLSLFSTEAVRKAFHKGKHCPCGIQLKSVSTLCPS